MADFDVVQEGRWKRIAPKKDVQEGGSIKEGFTVRRITPESLLGKRRYHFARGCAQYGLTVEGYAWMLYRQGFHCALCPDTQGLAIDHDHSCCAGQGSCGGCVRGLLCGRCNIGLGYLRDDRSILTNALAYLDS